ncbi:MAG: glycosyltransferase family 4 protein [Acidimicrobiales bacterium]
MRLAVLCPHFAPDLAPTGEVITRLVHELAARGHRIDVVTALPWYLHHDVEPGWRGRPVRRERTDWGTVTRVHPFPTDKRSIPRRALGFGAFSALAGLAAAAGPRVDVVLAMSPPLTLGLTGWAAGLARRAPLVFNVQDVFPDVAVEVGALTNRRVIDAARRLELATYTRSAAVTVLSEDLRDNLVAKVGPGRAHRIRVIPNFVDVDAVRPADRMTPYRHELVIPAHHTVVLYAGNMGFSQSLPSVVDVARRLADRPVTFLFNGGGSAREALVEAAAGLANVVFAPYQPRERLAEVLATGDIHLVPLRAGLARSSVPSKTYSILAAGRPLVAAIDEGTEVARVVTEARAGLAVRPDDPTALQEALCSLLDDPSRAQAMGVRGRAWVERWLSPAAVAERYEELFDEVRRAARRGRGRLR